MANEQIGLIKELTMSGSNYLEALSVSFDEGWDAAMKEASKPAVESKIIEEENSCGLLLEPEYIIAAPTLDRQMLLRIAKKYMNDWDDISLEGQEVLLAKLQTLIKKNLRSYFWDVADKLKSLRAELDLEEVDNAEKINTSEEVPF